MEQSKSLNLIEDSDDEELPDLFFSKSEPDSDNKNEISRGDIVWAEFRKFYWPALVRFVYKREKKVSIWYLDSPKKTFKVSLKKIKSFYDPKENTKIRAEVDCSPMKSLHTKVWLNALTYIRRQAEGHKDDPAAYFDLNQHYFALKQAKLLDAKCDVSNTEDMAKTTETISEESEEEILVSSDDEDGAVLEKKISNFYDLDDSIEDETKTNAIVECITSGKIDKHLLRIKNRRIQSIYQQTFDDAMKTDRKKLFGISACDVIKNLKKLKDISFYLMNLYEKIVEGKKWEMLDYITSVWLPEAINQAVILLDGGVLSEEPPKVKRNIFSSPVKKENSDTASHSHTVNKYKTKIENSDITSESSTVTKNKIKKEKFAKIKKESSDTSSQCNTVDQNEIENETNGKRSLRKRPPRDTNFYSESKDVSPFKNPRKKYKRR